jgi:hypothetical protein
VREALGQHCCRERVPARLIRSFVPAETKMGCYLIADRSVPEGSVIAQRGKTSVKTAAKPEAAIFQRLFCPRQTPPAEEPI